MKYLIFIVIFLFFSIQFVIAQDETSDSQLAIQYFQNKEYEKAVVIFEKLYKQNKSRFYFEYQVKCLEELKQYNEAENLIKRQLRQNETELANYVELGYLYKLQGNESQAEEQYKTAIKKITNNTSQVIILANAFVTKKEFDKAYETYVKGKQITNYPFHYELASLFSFQRKYPEMIEEYMELLNENPANIISVQSNCQYYLNNDIDFEFAKSLRIALMRRVQQKASKTVYYEMIIWLYLQQHDYENAVIHAISLDKRNNEQGQRLIDIGQQATENRDYETAAKAFEFVESKGNSSPFYYQAKMGLLNIMFIRISNGNIADKLEITNIAEKHKITLTELGVNPQTAIVVKNYSHLLAFYLGNIKEATAILESAIQNKNLAGQIVGILKIELGDIQLLDEDIWAATLTYAQAENDNKTNSTGDDAKFRKAKIAYYTGNYKWAEAQLDALKSSTSKLIANDAFELSQFLKDNSGFDSTEIVLNIFARAELQIAQNRDSLALITFDTIINIYSTSALIEEALYKKAQIYEKRGMYILAAENYQKIVDSYTYETIADDALYNLAYITEYQMNDKEKAKELYKKIITDYSSSIYVSQARKRFTALREQ